VLRSLVRRASDTVDRLSPPPAGITVLIYHRVGGGTDSTVDLPVDEFRRQLDILNGICRVIGLDDAVAALAAGGPVEPAVVLTFDDGTADFTDHAVPALTDAGVPATLYVASGFVETGRPFPWGAPPASWPALRDAAAGGLVTIGSHTHDHLVLQRLEVGAARADLDRSLDTIGERLGERPTHFAYPKAVPAPAAIEAEVRHRFRTAALAGNRVNIAGRCDLHRITRSPVKRGLDPDAFAALARGGGRLEGGLRAAAARIRYLRSTS
jgi:peptidoglycan/xylan/chitin deacetylase (PgdA/CDA1 family)